MCKAFEVAAEMAATEATNLALVSRMSLSAAAWKATLNVKCPHCGEVHEISVRETYINGALKRPISLGHLGGPR
jgi:hypothetical protein